MNSIIILVTHIIVAIALTYLGIRINSGKPISPLIGKALIVVGFFVAAAHVYLFRKRTIVSKRATVNGKKAHGVRFNPDTDYWTGGTAGFGTGVAGASGGGNATGPGTPGNDLYA